MDEINIYNSINYNNQQEWRARQQIPIKIEAKAFVMVGIDSLTGSKFGTDMLRPAEKL